MARCGLFDFNAGVAGEGQAPNDVSRHPAITLALFPPAPASIAMLEVVETIEVRVHDFVELRQILLAFGMRGIGMGWFDSAEETAHDVFGLKAEVLEGLGRDGSRQKTAHRLFGAAV